MSGLRHTAAVVVALNKFMVRHWKLLLWLVRFLEGGIPVLLWSVAFLGCVWGVRDRALMFPVEDLR